jgi:hypothetical protein
VIFRVKVASLLVPSIDHEMPLELVRYRPALAPELLRTMFGIDTPESAHVTLGSEVLSNLKPAERICDVATLVGDPKKPDRGIILEIQRKPQRRKKFTWPDYVGNLRSRKECDVFLMVFCFDKRTADWAAEPISMGHPEYVLKPLVQNLAEFPPITDLDEASQKPELTILLTKAHGNGPDSRAVLTAYCHALDTMTNTPDDIRAQYHEWVASDLSEVSKRLLEEILATKTPELHSILARKHHGLGRAEGLVEGEVRALLQVLSGRGLRPSDEEEERITSCTDPDLVSLWINRALNARSVDEIFD